MTKTLTNYAEFLYDLKTNIIKNPKAKLSLRVRLARERVKEAK